MNQVHALYIPINFLTWVWCPLPFNKAHPDQWVSKGHQGRRGPGFQKCPWVRTVIWKNGHQEVRETENTASWTPGAECHTLCILLSPYPPSPRNTHGYMYRKYWQMVTNCDGTINSKCGKDQCVKKKPTCVQWTWLSLGSKEAHTRKEARTRSVHSLYISLAFLHSVGFFPIDFSATRLQYGNTETDSLIWLIK